MNATTNQEKTDCDAFPNAAILATLKEASVAILLFVKYRSGRIINGFELILGLIFNCLCIFCSCDIDVECLLIVGRVCALQGVEDIDYQVGNYYNETELRLRGINGEDSLCLGTTQVHPSHDGQCQSYTMIFNKKPWLLTPSRKRRRDPVVDYAFIITVFNSGVDCSTSKTPADSTAKTSASTVICIAAFTSPSFKLNQTVRRNDPVHSILEFSRNQRRRRSVDLPSRLTPTIDEHGDRKRVKGHSHPQVECEVDSSSTDSDEEIPCQPHGGLLLPGRNGFTSPNVFSPIQKFDGRTSSLTVTSPHHVFGRKCFNTTTTSMGFSPHILGGMLFFNDHAHTPSTEGVTGPYMFDDESDSEED